MAVRERVRGNLFSFPHATGSPVHNACIWAGRVHTAVNAIVEKELSNYKDNLKEAERLELLLTRCVDHIVQFEDEDTESVLKSLGFTEDEIKKYMDI